MVPGPNIGQKFSFTMRSSGVSVPFAFYLHESGLFVFSFLPFGISGSHPRAGEEKHCQDHFAVTALLLDSLAGLLDSLFAAQRVSGVK